MDKLYIVTRRDLSPGVQACQGMHAMREFAHKFPNQERDWFLTSNHLCFLSVESEEILYRLYYKARAVGIPTALFYEPDLDYQLTALALSPRASEICAGLPLALVEY